MVMARPVLRRRAIGSNKGWGIRFYCICLRDSAEGWRSRSSESRFSRSRSLPRKHRPFLDLPLQTKPEKGCVPKLLCFAL
jgi:hypothetical protein